MALNNHYGLPRRLAMFKDLREFLDVLDKHQQLVRYTDKIMPEPDVSLVTCGAYEIGRDSPALLFDNLCGYKGKLLATNVHGGWTNLGLALGLGSKAGPKAMFHELVERWELYPGELSWVENPPCQEVVLDEFNLLEFLPMFKINGYDGGFYLSKSCVVTRDPDDPENFDRQGCGIYLSAVLDKNTIALQAMRYNPLGIHINHAEERGENLPLAICIGNDPVLSVMACSVMPPDQSRYKMAAAVKGAPIELAKTTDGYLDIPAGTEIVLEGELIARKRTPGGPFGEFLASYTDVRLQHEVKIRRVTHRKNPIFENLYSGRHGNEMLSLMGLNTCVPLYQEIAKTMPEVVAVNALYCHGITCIISMNPRFGGYSKSVAMRLLSTQFGTHYAKNVILVDGDVDPFDLEAVLWAMSTRIRGAQDVFVVPSTPGMQMDPTSEPPGMGVKVIYDATTPVHPEPPLRDAKMVDPLQAAALFTDKIRQLQNKTR